LKSLEGKKIKSIDCGDFHSLALQESGSLYSWGAGEKGECGHGKFENVKVPQKIKYLEGKNVV
jgi:alpha-tubulin suppressor-like RCC1 family protein